MVRFVALAVLLLSGTSVSAFDPEQTGGTWAPVTASGCGNGTTLNQSWMSSWTGMVSEYLDLMEEFNTRSYFPGPNYSVTSTTVGGLPALSFSAWYYQSAPGGTIYNGGSTCIRRISIYPEILPPAPAEPELLEWECGTWSENSFNFTAGGPDMCVDGQMYSITEEVSPIRNTDYEPDGTIICRDWYVATGESCTGGVVSNPGSGEGSEEWPAAHYCDQGGGSDGVSFCDTRDPNHPEYDPNLPPTAPGDIYCDEQGGHDGLSFCNTWSPHHPGHPNYDGTGDGSGGTSGEGSYPGPGGGGTGGTGEGGEGEEPPQIGFCPPGTVQSERHFHGEDQTAVCVPEGDEFDESLDGLDLSGELPPGWLVMPTLPVPSGGTCTCPADHTISVMGSSVPISYGPICGVAELLRPVFLLLVYLGLAFFLFRMVAGGNK